MTFFSIYAIITIGVNLFAALTHHFGGSVIQELFSIEVTVLVSAWYLGGKIEELIERRTIEFHVEKLPKKIKTKND